jgi:DNA-binding MarR family transcriptional regulator
MPYLLNRLGVRLGWLFTRRIGPYGLNLPMYRVLASLAERPDQKLSDLAQMTSAEVSTMSRMIGSMVDMGLVTRERLPNNERTVRINLTEKGGTIAGELMREAQHYEDVAISGLNPAEVESLKRLIVQIYDSLDVLEAELVAPAAAAERITP